MCVLCVVVATQCDVVARCHLTELFDGVVV